MGYDPTIYQGSAAHYLRGRPPYSDQLLALLTAELGLDGTGHLLDVGCGPGVLAVQLAPAFARVTGLEPDADMLAEAARHAAANGVDAGWIQGRAEDIADLDLGPLDVVTFGQSFHWTDREAVAEVLYDRIEPGGALVLVAPDIDAGPVPPGPGDPPIPHDEIRAVVNRYLGEEQRFGQGRRAAARPEERYADTLARTRWGRPRTLHAPGRRDLTQDPDAVVSNYLSMSWCAPHLFGDRLDAFVADVHTLLAGLTPTGRFWDWPGDTAVLIAQRPA